MPVFEWTGGVLLAAVVAFVIPVLVGGSIYDDASRAEIAYPGPWAYGVAALFAAGFVPGLFALAAYSSYKGDTNEDSVGT
jgi:sorbitol-specific phosphotransferase system component IIBC